ncbi:hypothetical protein CN679_12125 [Bacillus pseudomycoides]|nr:hypothetical protein CN679_12125 [Bacillus pseudomycoides]
MDHIDKSNAEREGEAQVMLSTEAQNFLLNMRIFLAAKGVKESDIESFLEDAELHLIEGENDGESVEDIFGSSPKVYVNELVRIGGIKLAILFVLVMIHTKLETRKVNI